MTQIIERIEEDTDLAGFDVVEVPCEFIREIERGQVTIQFDCGKPAEWIGRGVCSHGDAQTVLACTPCKEYPDLVDGDGVPLRLTWERL